MEPWGGLALAGPRCAPLGDSDQPYICLCICSFRQSSRPGWADQMDRGQGNIFSERQRMEEPAFPTWELRGSR